MLRILVCGGRDFKDEECVYKGLDRFRDAHLFSSANSDDDGKYDVIISGMAKGADMIAAEYATTYGLILKPFPADWKTHGRKAGYLRNVQMLQEGRPDVVVAFPGGKGTKMMIDLAQKACVPVTHVGRDPLGNIIMGTLGASSYTAKSPAPGIKTKIFQQKYIDELAKLKMLTPGQRDGLYQKFLEEETAWFASQDQAAQEYEEILNVQETFNGICGNSDG